MLWSYFVKWDLWTDFPTFILYSLVFVWQTAKINQGNIALKRVVESIANGDSHVPFRDSKLTMLLQVFYYFLVIYPSKAVLLSVMDNFILLFRTHLRMISPKFWWFCAQALIQKSCTRPSPHWSMGQKPSALFVQLILQHRKKKQTMKSHLCS